MHEQKIDLCQADAPRFWTGCIRPMCPVCPNRPLDIFSHPMRLVSPNDLISPPMHSAYMLQLPSVPTSPSSFPSSTDHVWRHPAYPTPFPSTHTTCPLQFPSGNLSQPCGISNFVAPLGVDTFEPLYLFQPAQPSAKEKYASDESRLYLDAWHLPGSPRVPGASVFPIHCPLSVTIPVSTVNTRSR